MPVTGLVPPLPTPLCDDALDLESLQRLVQTVAPYVDGYLVGGSVGEHPSLTVEERLETVRAVAECRGPEHTLVFSIADNALPNVRRLAEGARTLGADLLVFSPPNYFANTLSGLVAYLGLVATFTDAPLCLYDNPLASHTALSIADIAALAESEPRLTHIKVTDLALGKVAALRAQTQLVVLSGDDAVLWSQLSQGAQGAMVALPLVYPALTRQVWEAFSHGTVAEAARAYQAASHFIHVALGARDYVAVLKTVLAERGVIAAADVRLPLLPLAAGRRTEILGALDPAFAIR